MLPLSDAVELDAVELCSSPVGLESSELGVRGRFFETGLTVRRMQLPGAIAPPNPPGRHSHTLRVLRAQLKQHDGGRIYTLYPWEEGTLHVLPLGTGRAHLCSLAASPHRPTSVGMGSAHCCYKGLI